MLLPMVGKVLPIALELTAHYLRRLNNDVRKIDYVVKFTKIRLTRLLNVLAT